MSHKDMSFCSSKTCENVKCLRHRDNVEVTGGDVWWADFEPTCKEYLPVRESRTKENNEQKSTSWGNGG